MWREHAANESGVPGASDSLSRGGWPECRESRKPDQLSLLLGFADSPLIIGQRYPAALGTLSIGLQKFRSF